MIIGFTGTRRGMTTPQYKAVLSLVTFHKPTEVHHGGCVGADIEFAAMCVGLTNRPRIVSRPGESADGSVKLRAVDVLSDEILFTKTHFARNRDIVDCCTLLIAAPFDYQRKSTGGTWYTIGYANKHKKTVVVVFPDGTKE